MKRIENQYIVKPEEGIVVCKRINDMDDYIHYETLKKCSDSVFALINILYSRSLIYDTPEIEITSKHVGVAKCDPRDEFDERIGRDIARLIATKKYHSSAIKKYNGLIKYFKKVISELETIILSHEEKQASICEKLDAYKE